MRQSTKILLALAALPLAGCGSTAGPPVVHPSLVSHYTLDSGDELRVIVYGQEDLSNSYTVDKAGYISVPLIGAVAARGRTTQLLEGDIARQMRGTILRNPDVSVTIAAYRPLFITGEVGAGGQYAYVPGLTVRSAIAVAGGFSPRANRRKVEVTRQVNGEVSTLSLDLDDPIHPGDTITVGQRFF